MQSRSIQWLKAQEYVGSRFRICQEKDRRFVNDENFEHWIVEDASKRISMAIGDDFKSSDGGFSFLAGLPEITPHPQNTFHFIKPETGYYHCSWQHVTAVYEGEDGHVYIFTSEKK